MCAQLTAGDVRIFVLYLLIAQAFPSAVLCIPGVTINLASEDDATSEAEDLMSHPPTDPYDDFTNLTYFCEVLVPVDTPFTFGVIDEYCMNDVRDLCSESEDDNENVGKTNKVIATNLKHPLSPDVPEGFLPASPQETGPNQSHGSIAIYVHEI